MPAATGWVLVCEYEDAANANSVVSETKQFLVPNMRRRLLIFPQQSSSLTDRASQHFFAARDSCLHQVLSIGYRQRFREKESIAGAAGG
jgi:hypothetical protein